MAQTAVIAGVGPGLGESIARRFDAEGCDVALFARSPGYLEDLAADLGSGLAVPTDITDPDAVRDGFEAVRDAFGPVDVLVNHAGNYVRGGLLDLDPADVERAWRVGAYGGFLCSREAVPDMQDGDGGTVLFTGATSAIRGAAGGLAFAGAKFAARGMAESMARELGPEGVHVAHVVIDGQIRPPDGTTDRPAHTYLDPDAIAGTYWSLVEQDRSAWTLELDLRPHVEEF